MATNADYTIVFSRKALKEINHSWDWYEEQQQGLGDRFIEEVMIFIQKIRLNPLYFSVKVKELRAAKLKVFPFLIVYRNNEKEKVIRILSVFHTSRSPYSKFKS